MGTAAAAADVVPVGPGAGAPYCADTSTENRRVTLAVKSILSTGWEYVLRKVFNGVGVICSSVAAETLDVSKGYPNVYN